MLARYGKIADNELLEGTWQEYAPYLLKVPRVSLDSSLGGSTRKERLYQCRLQINAGCVLHARFLFIRTRRPIKMVGFGLNNRKHS